MMTCRLGGAAVDHFSLIVAERQFPARTGFDDGNWIHAGGVVRAGGMRADITGEYVRADEVQAFLGGLRAVHAASSGVPRFRTMEDWIRLSIGCRPNGELDVTGRITGRRRSGSRLRFRLVALDQTRLAEFITQLEEVAAAFPVVGAR